MLCQAKDHVTQYASTSKGHKWIPKEKYEQTKHTLDFPNSLSLQTFSVQWIFWTASGFLYN